MQSSGGTIHVNTITDERGPVVLIGKDAVIRFTPDHGWAATITDGHSEESWTLPIIGWAVVVNDLEADTDGIREADTGVEPVVLVEERYASVLSQYVRHELYDGEQVGRYRYRVHQSS